MSQEKFDPAQCKGCGQPLFHDKEECRTFIEYRMKQGYTVRSCCE